MKKSWSELTEAEINRNKRNTCEKCLYFSRDGSTTTAGSRHCEYLLITGHRRGCSPLECKKKGIFKARPTGRRRINRACVQGILPAGNDLGEDSRKDRIFPEPGLSKALYQRYIFEKM